MFHLPMNPLSFEAMLEDLGPDRSPLARIRTAAHAACVRRQTRHVSAARREADRAFAAILGAAENPFPALRHHH